jgi:hypothetical protein
LLLQAQERFSTLGLRPIGIKNTDRGNYPADGDGGRLLVG